jgi:hypothetical protein
MARTGFSVMSAEEALKQIAESSTDYYVYNSQKPGEDMSADDFKGVKEDFEKEVKEDPGRHKDTLEYKGVSKIYRSDKKSAQQRRDDHSSRLIFSQIFRQTQADDKTITSSPQSPS